MRIPGSSDKAAKPEGKDSDSAGKTQPGDDGIPAREGPAVLTVERVRGRAGETIKVTVKVEIPPGGCPAGIWFWRTVLGC